jgi:hypothetical protein
MSTAMASLQGMNLRAENHEYIDLHNSDHFNDRGINQFHSSACLGKQFNGSSNYLD